MMNIFTTLEKAVESAGDRPAVYRGITPYLSWTGLQQRVLQIAALLSAQGVREGDRVGLAMSNCPEFVELLYACWRIGAIAVPMNAKGHASDFRYMLEHCEASCCFVSADLFETLQEATAENQVPLWQIGSEDLTEQLHSGLLEDLPPITAGGDQPAWLFYTSGTTGRPKGATLTHRNLLAMAAAYTESVDRIAPGEHLIHAAPMSHGSGLYIIPHVANGASQVVTASGKFKETELLELLAHFSSCTFFAAPTMLQRLLDQTDAAELPGLKSIVLGGGPLYVEDARRALARYGERIAQIYGQGETPMTITTMSRAEMYVAYQAGDNAYLGSVGKPFKRVEVRVVDATGNALPAGEIGEVIVRGDTVMQGYWNNPQATADTLRDGWLYTGDMGCFDAAGCLTLKDRSKDLIISGGTNIYPREVEEVLLEYPAVKEACVIGVPDDEWGESVAAVLVGESGASLDVAEVDAFCLAHMARFKRPKLYRVVSELPKNATGKVLKPKVRELLAADLPS